jgi:glycerophosphoryl diester phosphodiesterase
MMVTIVAHRGAPQRARANTVESFLAALEMGADMIELDVRKTADNVLVTFHDPWISRFTRLPMLKDCTYRQLLEHTAKRRFEVPTLEQALRALSGKVMLDIELKEPGCEAEVIGLARANFTDNKFILSSFDPRIVAAVKAIDGSIAAGLILGDDADPALFNDSPAEVLAPSLKLFSDRRSFFGTMKKRGRRIAVWIVDSRTDIMSLLVDPLVDAIITNHPDKAIALRKKLSNREGGGCLNETGAPGNGAQ